MDQDRSNASSPLPLVEPEEVGVSSQRLKQITPFLQEKYVDQGKLPGLVTMVARHGKIVHFEASGYLDLEAAKPMPLDAIFRLFSNTKPITGVATMILFEEGRIGLDDPISKYLPAFREPRVLSSEPADPTSAEDRRLGVHTVPSRREITIRDCLRHTTGLPTPARLPIALLRQYQAVIQAATLRERVDKLAELPLTFHPGDDWEYHIGYPVLGVILEMVAGKTLEEFYAERIFEPLEMHDTSFYLPAEKISRFTTCYRPKWEAAEWRLEAANNPETSEKVLGPKVNFGVGGDQGGLLSTVPDHARFAQMLLNRGELDGVRIISRKTVELMTANHTGDLCIPSTGPGTGCGLGVGVRTGPGGEPGLRSVGAYGWTGGAATGYFADPEEDLFGICFTQMLGPKTVPDLNHREDFERLVYQALI